MFLSVLFRYTQYIWNKSKLCACIVANVAVQGSARKEGGEVGKGATNIHCNDKFTNAGKGNQN